MSACDISTFGSGFVSRVNKYREELDVEQFETFRIGDRVIHMPTKRIGKIHRFVQASGEMKADIRLWWTDPSSPLRGLLKMVSVFELDDYRKPEEEKSDV